MQLSATNEMENLNHFCFIFVIGNHLIAIFLSKFLTKKQINSSKLLLWKQLSSENRFVITI